MQSCSYVIKLPNKSNEIEEVREMVSQSNQQIRSMESRNHEHISKLQSVTKTLQEKMNDVEHGVIQFNSVSKNLNKAVVRAQRHNTEITQKVEDNSK